MNSTPASRTAGIRTDPATKLRVVTGPGTLAGGGFLRCEPAVVRCRSSRDRPEWEPVSPALKPSELAELRRHLAALPASSTEGLDRDTALDLVAQLEGLQWRRTLGPRYAFCPYCLLTEQLVK